MRFPSALARQRSSPRLPRQRVFACAECGLTCHVQTPSKLKSACHVNICDMSTTDGRGDYKHLLQEVDDPVLWERPRHFDEKGAQRRFAAFADAIAKSLALPFRRQTGAEIQDASFHSQLIFEWGSLRFSSFGDMIAFTPDHDTPPTVTALIETLAKDSGYVLVPTDILEERYTGRNPGVTGIRDWWTRYFDWV